jgi:replication-associated recombination protein RarA
MKEIWTKRGYSLSEVVSALQKGIRRADLRLAGYWAIELHESGFTRYLWRRLLVTSAEDCWGILTQEVESLARCWEEAHKKRAGAGRIFIAKAIILLCEAKKSREADHLTNLNYDRLAVPEEELLKDLEAARDGKEEIPDYAFDCHTRVGKMKGMTKEQFFIDEQAALKPRQVGIFDGLVEKLKK